MIEYRINKRKNCVFDSPKHKSFVPLQSFELETIESQDFLHYHAFKFTPITDMKHAQFNYKRVEIGHLLRY